MSPLLSRTVFVIVLAAVGSVLLVLRAPPPSMPSGDA